MRVAKTEADKGPNPRKEDELLMAATETAPTPTAAPAHEVAGVRVPTRSFAGDLMSRAAVGVGAVSVAAISSSSSFLGLGPLSASVFATRIPHRLRNLAGEEAPATVAGKPNKPR